MTELANKLVKQHDEQVAHFSRSVRAISVEFDDAETSLKFLDSLNEMVSVFEEQVAAAGLIFNTVMHLGCIEANNNEALLNSHNGYTVYKFLTQKRKAAELIGNLDEFNKALAAAAAVKEEAAEIAESDPERCERLYKLTWSLSSCQSQIHSVARQAEAITALQLGIMRFLGLHFWQGHKRNLRWEGDFVVHYKL